MNRYSWIVHFHFVEHFFVGFLQPRLNLLLDALQYLDLQLAVVASANIHNIVRTPHLHELSVTNARTVP